MTARQGRLAPEFQAKFGWLLGNLYSRAASPDWAQREGGKDELRNSVKSYLLEQIPDAGPVWVDDEVLDAARKAGMSFDRPNREMMLIDLEEHRPLPRLEQIVDAVLAEVAAVVGAGSDVQQKLKNRLLNNGKLSKLAN